MNVSKSRARWKSSLFSIRLSTSPEFSKTFSKKDAAAEHATKDPEVRSNASMNASLKSSSPALVTISLCLLVQAVEQFYQLGDPKLFELSVGRYETIVAFNVGLMLCLPWIGALGSIAAKAVGASREIAMRAAISPIALIAAMLMCLLVWDLTKTRSMVSSLAYSS